MKHTACDFQDAVARATRHGGWDESLDELLRAHLDSCEHCRELAATAGWMVTLAGDARNEPALPDPGLVWLQVRLEEVQQADERAQHPLEIAHVAALVVGAVGGVGLLVWEGSPLQQLWPKLRATLAAGQFDPAGLDLASPAMSAVALGLILFALLVLLRPVFTED